MWWVGLNWNLTFYAIVEGIPFRWATNKRFSLFEIFNISFIAFASLHFLMSRHPHHHRAAVALVRIPRSEFLSTWWRQEWDRREWCKLCELDAEVSSYQDRSSFVKTHNGNSFTNKEYTLENELFKESFVEVQIPSSSGRLIRKLK